jgi:hypothetical protein
MIREIIEFFNSNAGGIQAISSILMLIATLTYVIINSLMHQEIVKERKRYEDPDINLRFKPASIGCYYNLVVENISQVSAIDLEIVDYPSMKIISNTQTDNIGFIKNGIKFMGPKQKYESLFLNTENINSNNKNLFFKLKYKNEYEELFIKEFNFNANSFKDIESLGKPFEIGLVDEIKGIKKSLKKLN